MSKLTLYLPQNENKVMHIVYYNAFYNRVVSQFQEKVGCMGVLSGEHTALVVVAGLDKATISMHCYLAMARSPDILQRR